MTTTTPRRRPPTARPEVSRLEARTREQRSARRRRGARLVGQALLVLLPLAALAWVLLFSTWLTVERVIVVGTERVSPDEVTQVAAIAADTPLARVDPGRIERAVSGLAPVDQVRVRRSWPNGVRIEVTERVPVAGVAGPEGVLLLDDEGVPFATTPALPAGVVRLEVDQPGPQDPATRAALQVYRELPPALRATVRSVRAATASSVVLALPEDREVVWGGPGDTAAKAAATAALLELPGAIIDVSAPGVVVRR